VPAGAAFAKAAGASPGLETRHSQLALAELDRDLLRQWHVRAAERAAGFELLFWDNVYPEQELPAFAELCGALNSAPRGDLEVEDQTVTPEKARQWLAMVNASGGSVWTLVARERATGALAGCTELIFTAGRESIVQQGATMVDPPYRNLGLGRWLKAAMLERLLRERPEARFVRTDNAENNAPMLAINVALGFRPYMAVIIWQLDVTHAMAYTQYAASSERRRGDDSSIDSS
jgi:GNAT superfamily N-acetyltransferase